MKTKFTPGPWAICEKAPNDQWYPDRTIYDKPGSRRICDVTILGDKNAGIANANLIAAAPELYEALEYLINCAEYPTPKQNMQEAIKNAKGVLAKARGQEGVGVDEFISV